MTDQELIEGLIRKERNAIQYLVNHYQGQMIKTAYYFLHDMQEAEDLSQEILIDVLDALPHFKKSATLSTWIYRITVNKSLNHIKRLKRMNFIHNLTNLFGKEDPVVTVDNIMNRDTASYEKKENQRLLENAISQLPDNQRIAFILSKYDALPYKEIAEIMHVSISAVESLLHRAKMNLQKNLTDHFPEYQK